MSGPSPQRWPGNPAPGTRSEDPCRHCWFQVREVIHNTRLGYLSYRKTRKLLKTGWAGSEPDGSDNKGLLLSKGGWCSTTGGSLYSPEDSGLCSALRVEMDQKPKSNFTLLILPLGHFLPVLAAHRWPLFCVTGTQRLKAMEGRRACGALCALAVFPWETPDHSGRRRKRLGVRGALVPHRPGSPRSSFPASDGGPTVVLRGLQEACWPQWLSESQRGLVRSPGGRKPRVQVGPPTWCPSCGPTVLTAGRGGSQWHRVGPWAGAMGCAEQIQLH